MVNATEINNTKNGLKALLIERLVLRHALLEPVLNHHLSGQESQKMLEDFLDAFPQVALAAYGQHFQEPSLTAIYAETAQEAVDDLKGIVRSLAAEAASTFAKHGQPW